LDVDLVKLLEMKQMCCCVLVCEAKPGETRRLSVAASECNNDERLVNGAGTIQLSLLHFTIHTHWH